MTRTMSWLSLTMIGMASVAGAQGTTPEARLKAAGIELPAAPKAMANYVPAVRAGNIVYLAGQGPIVDGKPVMTGKVGGDVSEEDGYKAARIAILNSLAALRAEIGSLDRVRRVVKVTGWVNSAPGFTRQSFVVNGASDLLVQAFGEAGRHARTSVSSNELPFNIPVEIEMIVEVNP
ncbi:MAG TPA: RidA family protein [Gemmatimonadaceae bacterium]|nr:RidA family protein [Gemmatimonadaceae bacterium]